MDGFRRPFSRRTTVARTDWDENDDDYGEGAASEDVEDDEDNVRLRRERMEHIELRRLLHRMRHHENLVQEVASTMAQSWRSLLFRAELCQDLWRRVDGSHDSIHDSIHGEDEYDDDGRPRRRHRWTVQERNEMSRQVDEACRRAREVAHQEQERAVLQWTERQRQLQRERRKQQQQRQGGDDDFDVDDDDEVVAKDEPPIDLVERLFFGGGGNNNRHDDHKKMGGGSPDDGEEKEDNGDADGNLWDEDDYSHQEEGDKGEGEDGMEGEPTSGAGRLPRTTATRRQGTMAVQPQSFEELQRAQRGQMEEAIAQMARQMKDATLGISGRLQQQNTGTLNDLETLAEQNVSDVTAVATNVTDHNRSSRRKGWATWTLLFALAGIFVLCLLTIFAVPKSPRACLIFCGPSVGAGVQRPGPTRRLLARVAGGVQTLASAAKDGVRHVLVTATRRGRDDDDEHQQQQRDAATGPDSTAWGDVYDEDELERQEKERLDEVLASLQRLDDVVGRRDEKAGGSSGNHGGGGRGGGSDAGEGADDDASVDDDDATAGTGELDNPWGLQAVKDDKVHERDGTRTMRQEPDNPWGLDAAEGDDVANSQRMMQKQPNGDEVDGPDQKEGPPPVAVSPDDVNMDAILASLQQRMAEARLAEAEAEADQQRWTDGGGGMPSDGPARAATGGDRFDPTNAFERDGDAHDRFSPRDLRVAAASGDRTTLERYLSLSTQHVDRQDRHGWTALHLATRAGHEDTVRLLLERGADVAVENSSGQTPYLVAVDKYGPDHPIVRLFAQFVHGKDGDDDDDDDVAAEDRSKRGKIEEESYEDENERHIQKEATDDENTNEENFGGEEEDKEDYSDDGQIQEDEKSRLVEDTTLAEEGERQTWREDEEESVRLEEELRLDQETQRQSLEEEARKAAEEEYFRLVDELHLEQELERQRLEEEEVIRAAEDERIQREEEIRLEQEAERQRLQEEEAQKAAEEERQRLEEDEAERQRLQEEETQKAAETERQRREEEIRVAEETERQRLQEEEARKAAEEERLRLEEEDRLAEERRIAEESRIQLVAEETARRRFEEEEKKRRLFMPILDDDDDDGGWVENLDERRQLLDKILGGSIKPLSGPGFPMFAPVEDDDVDEDAAAGRDRLNDLLGPTSGTHRDNGEEL